MSPAVFMVARTRWSNGAAAGLLGGAATGAIGGAVSKAVEEVGKRNDLW